MGDRSVDVAVLGSGFAGSLVATLLAKQGRSVCLIERGSHPRFAIGESSTPLADFKLHEIADRYSLPRLSALCRYDTWMAQCPQAMRGVKRGFAYFSHREGLPFQTDDKHSSELLVTANSSAAMADTHWLRSDVDALFVDEAVAAGVDYLDQTSIVASEDKAGMQLRCDRGGRLFTIAARFLVVATGNPQVWSQAISIPVTETIPRTSTRCVFAHFAGVQAWHDVMVELGYTTTDHPFDCDQSALHHVFNGGWMWQLRFDDDTVSAGFLIDNRRHPQVPGESATASWQSWMSRFPSIARQFAKARVVRPQSGLQQVDQLQHNLRQTVGPCWALLPAAVGFSDPLFSTGIGHSLFSVDQLVRALECLDDPDQFQRSLATYSVRLSQEIDLIDRLVSLAYRASANFEHYILAAMPYFAAATTCEKAARAAGQDNRPAFLLADDPQFLAAVQTIEACQRRQKIAASNSMFEDQVREALRPFDHVGLLSSGMQRMVHYTAAR